MATSGRGSGVVGYNVQVAVDTEHHLIVTHDVINIGNDRGQLARMSKQAKQTLGTNKLDVIADRGYFDGQVILACAEAGITVTLPKPMTSGAKAEGRFGKQDFIYLPEQDVYRCPSGNLLPYHYSNVENGMTLRRYRSTAACQACAVKSQCTPSKERRIPSTIELWLNSSERMRQNSSWWTTFTLVARKRWLLDPGRLW